MKAAGLRIYVLFMLMTIVPASVVAQVRQAGIAATRLENTAGTVTHISCHGKDIPLNERSLYINASLKQEEAGPYAFRSLQEAVAHAKDGTEAEPTTLYIAPGVYWTDDPAGKNEQNKLIGLLVPQAHITMVGLSDDPDHTVIAGDRGQMAGSIGNWNTIGIGDAFHAYNITFGNYCNVDLVYDLDHSKDHGRRQKTITQAQVITKAHDGDMDKWLFRNCKFISFLNVFSRSNEPHRAYYSNCFFQCTDDAIGTGDINVYRNCDFKLYSNHPSGSASNIMQFYLGCHFDGVLRDSGADATIFFAKKNNVFSIIDCSFTGNISRLEWTDYINDDARHYVYNNTLHDKPVMVSPSKPAQSVLLNRASLTPFKVGDEYNIFNLLRDDDNWDPEEQRSRLGNYANLPYRLQLTHDKPSIAANTTTTVSYLIYPERAKSSTPVKWRVSDAGTLSISDSKDGTITVTGHNDTEDTLSAYVTAETPGKITALAYIDVLPRPLAAPVFSKAFGISLPENGTIRVDYMLDMGRRTDQSLISWYRATKPDGSDSIKVAESRLGEPLRIYPLTTGDIGYYLVAAIQPKHSSSMAGHAVTTVSRKISKADITTTSIHTNFRNIPVQRSTAIRDGWWTLDTHRPADLSQDFTWEPEGGDAWQYGIGHGGTADRYGLMTTGRGARLLYAQAGVYGDMSVTVALSPHKASGQGFGSATGQYADIYIKFDAKTLTGYGLRIQRTPSYADGVKFTLYKFVNGAGTPISNEIYSSVFIPGCHIQLRVKGTTLTAKVTTSGRQQDVHKDSGLSHEVNLSATIDKNTFGGAGLQHTGTVSSAGNRLMLESFNIDY